MNIQIDTQLTLADLFSLVDSNIKIHLSKELRKKIEINHKRFIKLLNTNSIYGATTGFGALASINITTEYRSELQANLIRSHAVGFPPYIDERYARAILLCRIVTLTKGYSGISVGLLERLLRLYNGGVAPAIPEQGSLGASGDLGPLASMALLLLGEGYGYHKGKLKTGVQINKDLDLLPYQFAPKEGLSLINGTAAMLIMGYAALEELERCLQLSLLSISMLLVSTEQSTEFLSQSGLELRAHKGVLEVAKVLRNLLNLDVRSTIPTRAQSVYSFRIVPYVLGSFLSSLKDNRDVLETEFGAVTDNPLIIEGEVYHGANFHGMPVAITLDQLTLTACHLTGILDRQVDFIIDPRNPENLTPFLAVNASQGHSGLEGAQYLLTSLHIENAVESESYSLRSIPTNAGNQDYVSLGFQSALRLKRISTRTIQAISIHLLVAAQHLALSEKNIDLPIVRKINKIIHDAVSLPYHDSQPIQEVISKIVECNGDLLKVAQMHIIPMLEL